MHGMHGTRRLAIDRQALNLNAAIRAVCAARARVEATWPRCEFCGARYRKAFRAGLCSVRCYMRDDAQRRGHY